MSIDNVQDITPRKQYVASGGQTVFPYDFPIFDDGDLVVDVDGVILTITTDYTVSGAGNDNGGNVTLTSGATAGDIVTIYRDIPIERDTDFQQNGPWRSASINDELDRMTLIDQQLELATTRALRVPVNDAADFADLEIPAASSRASKFLAFDANGNPTVSNGTGADAGLREDIASGAAGAVTFVDTIADMKALTGLVDGALVQPKEFYSGDGFKPRQRVFIADATPPAESATVIHDNAGAGYFLLRDDGGAIDLRETGAKFDGVTDDTTNIQRGLNGFKWSENPPGKTAKVTAKLTIPAFAKWTGAGKYSSIISKEFNGDFADIGTGAVVDGFAVLGNGGTYTGRGFLVNSGSGSQIFGGQMRIVDFNGYCIECTADGAGNGMQVLQGAEISRTTAGDVAIRLPVDTSAKPRFFIGVNGSSSTLIDCNGADDVVVHGCFMRNILTTSSTKKLALTGNRIATVGAGLQLYGVNHSITGNIVAGNIVAESGLTSSTISGNLTAGVVTDNSASASNTIYEYSLDYTPTWLGSVTNPVIGDGSISGKLIRRGKMVTLQIVLNIGSTTTTGSGIWTFGLPASLQYLKGKFTSAGVARGFRSGVAFYTGVTIGNTSSSNFVINVTTSGGTNNWGPTVPATWATGDQIIIQHEYEIST